MVHRIGQTKAYSGSSTTSPLAASQEGAASRKRLRIALLAGATLALAACGGGGESGQAGGPAPAPAPVPAPPPPAPTMVRVTVQLDVPSTLFPGQVYLRAGNSAISRAEMTRQDGSCSYSSPGSWSCPFNIPRGQTVTLVANDQLSEISFGTHTVAQRNLDPRGIRSQFAGFSGPCTTTERGVCVFTASSDMTITAQYTALTWTRVNLVGLNNWRITIDAPPVLSLWGNQRPPDQHEVWSNGVNPIAACATDTDPVHCYSIITPANGTIKLEALPPVGPLPQGAIGPLEFVGYDGACQINGANPICPLTSGVDQVAVMKWEYYRCGAVDVPNGATNSIWKYPPGYLTGCRLVRP